MPFEKSLGAPPALRIWILLWNFNRVLKERMMVDKSDIDTIVTDVWKDRSAVTGSPNISSFLMTLSIASIILLTRTPSIRTKGYAWEPRASRWYFVDGIARVQRPPTTWFS